MLLPDLDQFSPPPSGVLGEVDEDTGQLIEAQAVPTWDEPSRAEAVAAAETAMAAFARPDLEDVAWWDGVEPLLSAEAARSYAYVDPASIPATGLTGAGTLVEQTSAYVAGVQVPTDAGTYLLILSRTDAAAPWLVERFDPPAEVG
ncbi:hypothetical protein [Aquipuribacter hungaricus]|uniref:hypothetical protein n=1 Tax=Aquipuribacter hungaricus TaxID=545624 RepID=UPI0030EBA05C